MYHPRMNRPPRLLPILALVSLAGCGAKTKDKSGEEAADPRIVTVDEKGIFVGGARIGDAPSEDIQKVDSLFALTANRSPTATKIQQVTPIPTRSITHLRACIRYLAVIKAVT